MSFRCVRGLVNFILKMTDNKLLLPEHKCRVIVEKRELTSQSSVELRRNVDFK